MNAAVSWYLNSSILTPIVALIGVRPLVAVENISENASDLISTHDAFSQSQVVRTHLHC